MPHLVYVNIEVTLEPHGICKYEIVLLDRCGPNETGETCVSLDLILSTSNSRACFPRRSVTMAAEISEIKECLELFRWQSRDRTPKHFLPFSSNL